MNLFRKNNNLIDKTFVFVKNKIKYTTYKFLFYILGFILIVKSIKFSFNKIIHGNSEDKKYDLILNSLNELERQNEELRIINQKLMDSMKK